MITNAFVYLRKLPTYEQCRHLGRGKGNREAQPQLIVKQSMPEDDDEEEENCSRKRGKITDKLARAN